ncbi:hypothetical protein MASR2M48_11900 [Spirochaetota bacterium]
MEPFIAQMLSVSGTKDKVFNWYNVTQTLFPGFQAIKDNGANIDISGFVPLELALDRQVLCPPQ